MASNDDKPKSPGKDPEKDKPEPSTGKGTQAETQADARPAASRPGGPTIDLKANEVKDGTTGAASDAKQTPPERKPTATGAGARTTETGAPQRATVADTAKSASPGGPSSRGKAGSDASETPGGGLGLPLAAVFGGAIGAALVYALLQLGGMIGADDAPDLSAEVEDLRQSVSQLSDALAAVPEAAESPAIDLAPLETEIADIRSAVDAAQARIAEASNGGDADAALADLSDRLAALETAQAEAQSAVADLGARLSDSGAGGAAVDLAPVEDRLAALESQIASVEASVGSVDDRIAEAVASVPQPDLSPLRSRLDEIGGQVEALSGDIDNRLQTVSDDVDTRLSSLADEVAALGDRMGAVEAGLAELQSEAGEVDVERRAAYLVALSGLQNAASGSGPFKTELDAVRALSGDGDPFADLAPYAESGVPSAAELTRSFRDLTGPILDAVARDSADGVVARLAAGAQSLVRIRPTGYVAGDSAGATVARIESLLEDRKIEAAVDEWETLPEAGKAVSQDWAEAARQRIALDAALSGSPASGASGSSSETATD